VNTEQRENLEAILRQSAFQLLSAHLAGAERVTA
jgi:hypothetical protein